MRSISLVCALVLAACSSAPTGQTNADIAGQAPSNQSDNGGGGKGNGSGGTGNGGGSAGSAATVLSGCTYTQGFWKNHPSAWPVTSLRIGGVIYSEQQLLTVFDTAPMGDASLILAHQLVAALLNTANGAATSATVQQAITDAQAWMSANLGGNAGLPYGVPAGSSAGQQATAVTQTLDDFNSGLAGTPHCGTGGGGSGSGSGSTTTISTTSSSSTTTSTSTTTANTCGAGIVTCSATQPCPGAGVCVLGCCD